MTDDLRLLQAFRAGDSRSFNALYDRYACRVMAFARKLTGSAEDAEDLTQEVFLAAFRGRAGFRASDPLLPWLLGIAARRWRDANRRRRLPTVPLDDWGNRLPLGKRERDAPDADVLNAMAVASAIRDLAPALRLAFLLVASQGLTHKEAARELNCPVGTLKWRVAEATRQLRRRLSGPAETEEDDVLQLPSC